MRLGLGVSAMVSKLKTARKAETNKGPENFRKRFIDLPWLRRKAGELLFVESIRPAKAVNVHGQFCLGSKYSSFVKLME